MSFFKRKEKNLIPPVADPISSRGPSPGAGPSPGGSYRSTSSTYVASRDGDLAKFSSTPPPQPAYESSYKGQSSVGDVYSRGQKDINQDRGELFAGYNPEKAGSGRFFNDGPGARRGGEEAPEGEENEDDVEGIKQQLRFTKQESVNSTRNALRLAREAEETARNTLGKLGDQSEKLASTERHLDVSKGHSMRAEDKTDELKQLNRSIFRPVITFNKDAKRAAAEAKVQQRYDDDREEREKAMMDIRDTQNRLGRAAGYGRTDDDETVGGRRIMTQSQQAIRKEQRKRYQFDATASDDEMEDELDDNLNEISDMTKRLKALGSAMGEELDKQNERIGRITEKTDGLDNRLYRNTQKLNRIK
ncbi:protein transport protein sec9 [Phanerochaete sordida]|uniref:Protein transport protein sec9 n=1 Tax=Phanerochaete sordida TaxID=48140 RepID=A0A9P3G0R5_9APHY|nr:protein transport protein sec9 [Phanerochaete sordida]